MLLKRLTSFYYLIFLLLCKSDYYYNDTKYINILDYKPVVPTVSNDINLIIPKIDLDIYTTYDTSLKQGVEIHKLSTKPSDKNSTLILMGHSGIGQNVFFNRLYQLEVNDLISIDYVNRLYNYVIEEKSIITKGSEYSFEFNNNYLYLITCYYHNKQIVIKAKMANY